MKNEWIGILGTVLILTGFLSDSEKRIRLFDMAGSACFVIYGILIGALSNVLLNGTLIVVHIVKLHRMKKRS